jgi:hypothetical protein
MKSQDMRMIQFRRRFYFCQKTIRNERSGKLRVQYLERDRSLVLYILREINSRHAALSELAIDRVRLGESNA